MFLDASRQIREILMNLLKRKTQRKYALDFIGRKSTRHASLAKRDHFRRIGA
jgi:hypothetical protein